jgi:deoxyribodipyrimidine photo-lyase
MTSLDKLVADPRIVVRHEAAIDPRGRCVVYRMRRTQRALDNPALETAIAEANVLEQPVVVFFGLLTHLPMANLRHYTFMLQGLEETAQKLVPGEPRS